MQVRRTPSRTRKSRRGGFTLIELLVVISIIALLIALLLPGIQNSRRTARRLQCSSQQRNVMMASQNYAATNNQNLPYLLADAWDPDADRMDIGGSTFGAPWPVQLLPYLDQQELFNRITTIPGLPAPNNYTQLSQIPLQIFTCPDDANQGVGSHMSFVANAGPTTRAHWDAAAAGTSLNTVHTIAGRPANPGTGAPAHTGYDWSFNGPSASGTAIPRPDQDVTRAAGAFHQQYASGGFRRKVDGFPDGTTYSAIFSENLAAGDWSSPDINDIAYVFPFETGSAAYAIAPNESTNLGLGPVATTPPQANIALSYLYNGIGHKTDPAAGSLRDGLINQNRGASIGTAPRPSSNHAGVVNVFFADGHGQTIAENVDTIVWWNLQTPSGQVHGENIQGDF